MPEHEDGAQYSAHGWLRHVHVLGYEYSKFCRELSIINLPMIIWSLTSRSFRTRHSELVCITMGVLVCWPSLAVTGNGKGFH